MQVEFSLPKQNEEAKRSAPAARANNDISRLSLPVIPAAVGTSSSIGQIDAAGSCGTISIDVVKSPISDNARKYQAPSLDFNATPPNSREQPGVEAR